MKFIHKGKEPKEWTAYKKTPGVAFSAEPELKKALLLEQGYICCYCMCRINYGDMKVEHYVPRNDTSKIFDYDNLFAACEGKCASDENCDTRKKNTPITIHPADPRNNCETIVHYQSKDAAITCIEPYYSDIQYTLNLNDTRIRRNRMSVLVGALQGLNSKHGRGVKWTKPNLQLVLNNYRDKDAQGKFKPYCQIVVYYLNKKILSI